MNRGEVIRCLRDNLLVDTVPNRIDALLVVQTLKDTVASNHEEVKVVLKFETPDFRVANDNVLVSTVLLLFSFDVSECSRD